MKALLEQICKLWVKLDFNQKISLVSATIGVGIVVTALIIWVSRPQYQLLCSRLDNKELAEIVAALDEKAIPYQIEQAGSAISVPRHKIYAARMHLASSDIPNGGTLGFELFDRTHFGVSDFVQRVNYSRALQGELARTIAQLKGVREARVMIVMPENRLLAERAQIHPTASVFVDTGVQPLSLNAVNSIRSLVANAVEGLSLNEVAIIDATGKVLSEELVSEGEFGFASTQMRFQKSIEDYLAHKVEGLLSTVLGSGQVVARVGVTIDNKRANILQEQFDPEGQVVRTQTTSENNHSNVGGNIARNPGVQSNMADLQVTTNETQSNSSEIQKNKSVSYDISKVTSEILKTPGSIEKISAAVFVALRHKEEDGKMVPNYRSKEEIQGLRVMIANALGIDLKLQEQISVEEVAFAQVASPLHSEAKFSSSLFKWFPVIKEIGAFALAIFMFGYFVVMVKRSRANKTTLGNLVSGDDEAEPIQKNSSKAPTPESINELLDQKPENVSFALKNWLEGEEN